MAKGDYSHAKHTAAVVRGSKARCGKRAVLFALIHRAEFKRPEVTITKRELIALTGLERKAVIFALSWLRDEGCIAPVPRPGQITGLEGGRGVPVTYRLIALGQGGEDGSSGSGAGRTFPQEDFSLIHRRDGFDAAMRAKRLYEGKTDL